MYSRQIESQLHEIERASVADYVQESPHMAALHSKIQVLKGVVPPFVGDSCRLM